MMSVRPQAPKANSRDVQAVIACVLLLASVAFATFRTRALSTAPTGAPVELLAVDDGGPPEPPPDDPDSRLSPTLPLPPPKASTPSTVLAAR